MARHLAIDISSTPVFVAGPTLLRDPVVTEFQQYAAKVFPIHPAADFNRHIVATTDGVPTTLSVHCCAAASDAAKLIKIKYFSPPNSPPNAYHNG